MITRVVTMHQPNYLPWIGLFSKINLANHFIIYDTAQYTNNGVINRNKIRNSSGWCYLTIPINRRFSYTKIQDVLLPEQKKWQGDHWKTISQNYAKADHFQEHQSFFEKLYRENFQYLWQLNEKILHYLLTCFKIRAKVLKASELDIDPNLHKTEAIIAYLKKVGADVYISGPSGKDYLEFDKFRQNKIQLKFFEFQHPIYKQRFSGFEPNLAAIDLLFNMGHQSGEIIKTSGSTSDNALTTTP